MPLPTTPDSWIRHEAIYTAAVHAVGAPAPQVLDVIEQGGRTVIVYQRVVGPTAWEYLCEHPREGAAIGVLLAELHSRIVHLTPPMALPRRRDRLVCKIRVAARAVGDDLLGALDLLPPDLVSPRLCHGDLHPGNVILAADGPVVIDWFDACRGEPAGDVARSSLLMGAGGATAWTIPHLAGAAAEVILSMHQAYIESVVGHLELGADTIGAWCRIEAAARLAEGVAAHELLAIWRAR